MRITLIQYTVSDSDSVRTVDIFAVAKISGSDGSRVVMLSPSLDDVADVFILWV